MVVPKNNHKQDQRSDVPPSAAYTDPPKKKSKYFRTKLHFLVCLFFVFFILQFKSKIQNSKSILALHAIPLFLIQKKTKTFSNRKLFFSFILQFKSKNKSSKSIVALHAIPLF